MSMADPLPEDDELRAAELALALLDADERSAALAQAERDPAFAAAYRRWQDHAAALLDGPAIAPSPAVWAAIAQRLPANDVRAVDRRTLRWWQGGTLAASAAAIVLAVVAVNRSPLPPPPVPVAVSAPVAPLVAVLTGKRGVVTVSYDPASGRLTSAPNGVEIGRHSPELWVIPADGKPRSLGVIRAAAPAWTQAPAPAVPALGPGATLAISVEPIGGSPTGQPTGAVILTGKIASA